MAVVAIARGEPAIESSHKVAVGTVVGMLLGIRECYQIVARNEMKS